MTSRNLDDAWREFAAATADAMHEIAMNAIRDNSTLKNKDTTPITTRDKAHADMNPQTLEIMDAARFCMDSLREKKDSSVTWFSKRDQDMLTRLESAFSTS